MDAYINFVCLYICGKWICIYVDQRKTTQKIAQSQKILSNIYVTPEINEN